MSVGKIVFINKANIKSHIRDIETKGDTPRAVKDWGHAGRFGLPLALYV